MGVNMIKDKVVAKKVSDILLQCGKELDASVLLVKENCTEEELNVYRKAIGKVMGELLIQVMNPLYRSHPEIKPSELHVPKSA